MYHKEIQDHVNDGLWNGIYAGGKDVAWNLPSGEFCNNADEDKFIVVQTLMNGRRGRGFWNV